VWDEVDLTHFRVGDSESGVVVAGNQISIGEKTGLRFRGADEVENLVAVGEGFASPVSADLAEQTMLDGIPLGSAGWVVADSDGQTERSAEGVLNRFLPGAAARAVASSAVRNAFLSSRMVAILLRRSA